MRKITHYDTMCPAVVAAGNCSKSFLPSSIPLNVKQNAIKLLNKSLRNYDKVTPSAKKSKKSKAPSAIYIVINKEYGSLKNGCPQKQSTYDLEFYGFPILLHSAYFLAKEEKMKSVIRYNCHHFVNENHYGVHCNVNLQNRPQWCLYNSQYMNHPA